jgi:UPF0271 protein
MPRGNAGAVISDPTVVGTRAVRLATDHEIEASDGTTLPLVPTTLCLHGDTPGAVALARIVRGALEAAGLAVEAFAAR